jgi:Calcineurin-like phosphoesterase superfamily domain
VRYLVLADIHANLQALDAVLADATRRYDQVLVLGDLVGYGANPIEAIDRTIALGPVAMIRGNHDKVCAGRGARVRGVDGRDPARLPSRPAGGVARRTRVGDRRAPDLPRRPIRRGLLRLRPG